MTFQRIITAIDRSPHEKWVFSQAVDQAQRHAAQLLLVHCLSGPSATTPPPMEATSGIGLHPVVGAGAVQTIDSAQLAQQAWEEQRDLARDWLETRCQEAIAQGVATEYDCRTGDPGQEICQLAATWNADLIVIGRRGYTGLTEALLGSTSNYVVHNAPCAVLVLQLADVAEEDPEAWDF